MLLYMIIIPLRGGKIDMKCLDRVASFLFYAVIVDFSIEVLDFIHRLYESEESIKILSQLVTTKLFMSLVVLQILLGMLLPLVPEGFVPLAGPPSLDSSTRDVYTAGLRLTPSVALRLLHSVASAVAHLHARGVLHGDLYAHNTLWYPDTGQAWLSDMGAATVLPSGDAPLCRALQAQEVLALGRLMTEVLAHVDGGAATLPAVTGAAQACTALRPADRPAVSDVVGVLAGLCGVEI